MRRKPNETAPQVPGPKAYQAPGQEHAGNNPQSAGDTIETFVASGGSTFFLRNQMIVPVFDPTLDGVQLITSFYVPRGRTGWIKQIRVAPYCPAPLANPWQGWPANWQDFEPSGAAASTLRATAQAGLYSTPIGWESYFDANSGQIPHWEWTITIIPESLAQARAAAGAGPFLLADPTTWYLAENIAVPSSVYRSNLAPPAPLQLPGRMPGGRFDPQRVQVNPGDPINWHLLIPEQNTALLWARWVQSPTSVRTRDINGGSIVALDVLPLLPSFGQLVGYTQATDSPAALDNARHGWGG